MFYLFFKNFSKIWASYFRNSWIITNFIYVGYRPVTDFIPKEILDENGYVKVNEKLETEINGVYAIGDIINKDTYQLVTAAADGARVITNMK